MTGTDVAVVLVVLGLGGLVVWVLTREDSSTIPIKSPEAGLCEAAVGIGSGAASKGQVSVSGSNAAGVCDFGEKVLTQVTNTLGRGGQEIGNFLGRPGESVDRSIIVSRTNCTGWDCAVRPAADLDKNGVQTPLTPAVVSARRTFLSNAINSGGHKL